jgi:hypothetical protein
MNVGWQEGQSAAGLAVKRALRLIEMSAAEPGRRRVWVLGARRVSEARWLRGCQRPRRAIYREPLHRFCPAVFGLRGQAASLGLRARREGPRALPVWQALQGFRVRREGPRAQPASRELPALHEEELRQVPGPALWLNLVSAPSPYLNQASEPEALRHAHRSRRCRLRSHPDWVAARCARSCRRLLPDQVECCGSGRRG